MSNLDADEPNPETADDYLRDRMIWDNRERVMRDYNITLSSVAVGWGDMMPTVTSSVMAGDPITDMSVLFGHMTLAAMVGGLILPVSAYTTADSDVMSLQRFLTPGAIFGGEIWSVMSAEPRLGNVLGVNLDIANALGLEDPGVLFDRGEWNWDVWREMMILATRDTTGDGIIDQFGLSGPQTDIMLNLFASNAAPMINDDLQYAFDHPHSLRALDFFFHIFNTDRVWNYDQAAEDPMGDHGRNSSVWRDGNSLFFDVALWMVDDDIPFEFGIVPYPPGPDNHRGYTWYSGFPQAMTILTGVQNPHDVHLIYERLMGWAGDEYWMVEEGTWVWARNQLRREADVQRWLNHVSNDNVFNDLARTIAGFYWVAGDFASAFWNNEHSVATAVEAFRPERQASIDELFN
jgi:multiple sugar transport system substrate-binding protein